MVQLRIPQPEHVSNKEVTRKIGTTRKHTIRKRHMKFLALEKSEPRKFNTHRTLTAREVD